MYLYDLILAWMAVIYFRACEGGSRTGELGGVTEERLKQYLIQYKLKDLRYSVFRL